MHASLRRLAALLSLWLSSVLPFSPARPLRRPVAGAAPSYAKASRQRASGRLVVLALSTSSSPVPGSERKPSLDAGEAEALIRRLLDGNAGGGDDDDGIEGVVLIGKRDGGDDSDGNADAAVLWERVEARPLLLVRL